MSSIDVIPARAPGLLSRIAALLRRPETAGMAGLLPQARARDLGIEADLAGPDAGLARDLAWRFHRP